MMRAVTSRRRVQHVWLLVCVALGLLALCGATMTRAAEGDASTTTTTTVAAAAAAAAHDTVATHTADEEVTVSTATATPSPHSADVDNNNKQQQHDDEDDDDDDEDEDDDEATTATAGGYAAHDAEDAAAGRDGVDEAPMRCLAIFARTQKEKAITAADAHDHDGTSAADAAAAAAKMSSTHVLFPTLTPGVPTRATIAYENSARTHNHTIILAVGYLQPQHDAQLVVQNFSVVRHGRVVRPGETANVEYAFRVDEYTEPGQYNLVLGLYVQLDGTARGAEVNNSNANVAMVTAFNATVTVVAGGAADARMAMTYVTLFAICAAVAYAMAWRLGLLKYTHHAKQLQHHVLQLLRGRGAHGGNAVAAGAASSTAATHSGAARSSSSGSGSGGGDAGGDYNVEYISAEHLRYREKILAAQQRGRQSSSSSPGAKKRRA